MATLTMATTNGGHSSHPSSSTEEVPAASGHVSMSDATIAIKNLDRHAFTRRALGGFDDADDNAAAQQARRKIQRVSDVVALQSRDEGPAQPSRFSRLSGIGQLHRERARQRRQAASIGAAAGRQQRDKTPKADAQRSSSYRPFSLSHLLQRLSTFSISTYSAKPDIARALSPLGMAMKGWSHGSDQERDGVQCSTCSARWIVKVSMPLTGTRAEQERAWQSLEPNAESEHQGWCPWRIRSCDPSLYRVPIRSLPETQAEVNIVASELAASQGIEFVSVSSDIPSADLASLSAKFPTAPLPALTLALLGWQSTQRGKPVQQSIVACRMCARRAGLWTYAAAQDDTSSVPRKAFDAVREHKAYCPVINGEVQSGRWLVTTSTASSDALPTPSPHAAAAAPPAYLTIVRLLLGSRRDIESTRTSVQASVHDMRQMRSHEILSKVKGLLDGVTTL